VNDAYLKTNKVEKGIEDYFGVVQFVMDFETDLAAQKRVEGIEHGAKSINTRRNENTERRP